MLSRALRISMCIPRASLQNTRNREKALNTRHAPWGFRIASTAIGQSITIGMSGQIRISGIKRLRIFRPLLTILRRIIDGGRNILAPSITAGASRCNV